MIPPFRFFWSKILPISYSNYLSETEILEFLRKKIDECIKELNRVEEYIETDLPDEVKVLVLQVVNEYLAELQATIKDLQEQLDKLQEHVDEQNDNLRKAMEECCQEVNDRIDSTNELIYDEIATLDAKIQGQIAELDSRIRNVENWYDFMKDYIDKQIALSGMKWVKLLNRQYDVLTRYVRRYFDELSKMTIKVTSPITAREVTLQYALEEIVGFVSHGLTAWEYRQLNLTAEEYRELYLTAEEYRLYGVWLIGQTQDVVKMFDLEGRETEQPLSSVYEVFGNGITADMGGLDITAETYRNVSDRYGAMNLDKYGEFILKSQLAALYLNTIHVHIPVPLIIDTSGVTKTSIVLIPDMDEQGADLPQYVSMLDSDSLRKLVITNTVKTRGDSEWITGTVTVTVLDTSVKTDGTFSVDVLVNNTAEDADGNTIQFDVDFMGITQVGQLTTYAN